MPIDEVKNLGCINSIDIIRDLVSLNGKRVVDVGCGNMAFSRLLADAGAEVLAIDPDDRQAEANQNNGDKDGHPRVTFVHVGADSLPADSASVDGVYFSFSLHHVPEPVYAQAFSEVQRVLKPGGHLCVIEPADGPLNDVMKLFHDESRVRSVAQDAIDHLAVPMFRSHAAFMYHSIIEYASFDDYASRFEGRTFDAGYRESDVRLPEVEAAFERLGKPDYRFESRKLMRWLDRPLA